MIFRNRSPKGIFGQNMSDLPNGPLTDGSRSLQSAVLKCSNDFTAKFRIFITLFVLSIILGAFQF